MRNEKSADSKKNCSKFFDDFNKEVKWPVLFLLFNFEEREESMLSFFSRSTISKIPRKHQTEKFVYM